MASFKAQASDLSEKIDVAEFCTALEEKKLSDVILRWLTGLKEQFDIQNGASLHRDHANQLILAIERNC